MSNSALGEGGGGGGHVMKKDKISALKECITLPRHVIRRGKSGALIYFCNQMSQSVSKFLRT